MKYLLDTHAVLWAAVGDERLPEHAVERMSAPGAQVYYSAVSAYEMALAHALGRWPEAAVLLEAFGNELEAAGWRELPLLARHAVAAGSLPMDHRDPFDRLLSAQSLAEHMILVSREKVLDQFGVKRLWTD